ncbi:hypothetical protein BC827DRAFT_1297514 [Russula dissimulans]|nr:hypothetical protein BC827DRAFT_1159231 [Russula dissimulans]KAH9959491.1 hypothetical protein BC827DRAFT_1301476 [Russula dissimulans]KAH9960215.1 hypothetical protein BC827DRAFT_1297514 [Russula dissimulans]
MTPVQRCTKARNWLVGQLKVIAQLNNDSVRGRRPLGWSISKHQHQLKTGRSGCHNHHPHVSEYPDCFLLVVQLHLAFNAALEAYEKATKNNLRTHPIATKLQSCDSTAAILSVLQDLVQQFEQARNRDENLRKWLEPTVNVLLAFSATLGDGFGLLFSPAKVIFTGIASFFRRLESYTAVPPTLLIRDMVVKIMVEVLHILAIVTTEIRLGRRRKYLKQLLRKSNVEDALKNVGYADPGGGEDGYSRNIEGHTHVILNNHTALAIARQTTSNVEEEKRFQAATMGPSKWLSPPDPSMNHNIARSLHHARTASWFFESDVFEEWKSTASFLWIYGKPDPAKVSSEKRSLRTLILSILCQLATQSNLYCGVLSRLCSTHDNGARKPSDRALRRCLTEMLSLPGQGPIYLILDALDECPNNSGCQVPERSARVSLHNQRGQRKDIVDYINSVVYSDMKMRRWREEDKRLVIETLSERADGMFRWVLSTRDPSALSTTKHPRLLDELPETLDETYERILRDIHKCLAAAVRPLRVEELAEVLAIDFDAIHRVIDNGYFSAGAILSLFGQGVPDLESPGPFKRRYLALPYCSRACTHNLRPSLPGLFTFLG